jgi:mitogen-activated protein kinase 1/3
MLGPPDAQFLNLFNDAREKDYIRGAAHSQNQGSGRNLAQVLVDTDPLCTDLIQRMLHYHPDHRITVDEALAHPYLSDFFTGEEKIRGPVSCFDFDFEFYNLTASEFR